MDDRCGIKMLPSLDRRTGKVGPVRTFDRRVANVRTGGHPLSDISGAYPVNTFLKLSLFAATKSKKAWTRP
jgi:hypothetical protein